MFTVWILVVLLSVSAFDSYLTTTPWDSWNQSLGSMILSIAPGWGFNRTTDSLEAIRDKIDTLWWGDYQNCETVVQQRTNAIDSTITCPIWKSIRSHATTCYGMMCWIKSMTKTSISWWADWINTHYFTASILCCDD